MQQMPKGQKAAYDARLLREKTKKNKREEKHRYKGRKLKERK